MLNVIKKLSDDEKALLLFVSLPRSYKDIVQSFLIGRECITFDQVLEALRENDRFMERHDGEDKKGSSDTLYGEGFRVRAKEKDNQATGSIKGEVTIVTRSVTFARRKGSFK